MRFKHCVISVSVTLSALGFPARTSPWVGVGNFAKLNIRQLAVGATPGLAEAPNTKSSSSVPLPRKVPKKFVNHPFEYHEEIELDITDLTNLGYGLGRTTLPDGGEWVVMVEYALPGEKVKCRIFKNFNSYSEADLLEVIVSSPDRVEPQCKYYQMCGGCQYQHFSIEGQRAWKKKQVEQVLQRIGKLPDVEVNDVKGTQDLYGYRAKITPHYNAPTESRPLAIGFQQRGTRSVIDIEFCEIATAAVNTKLSEVRSEVAAKLQGTRPKKGATLLLRECEEGVATDQRATITQRVGDLLYRFKAGEFFQNNPFILQSMVDHVLTQAQGEGITHCIDAYCGSGLFSVAAGRHFERVYGIEVSEKAVAAAKENAQLNNLTNVDFFCGSSEAIFEFTKDENIPNDQTAMIIDPPRKGCDEVFLRQLQDFSPRKVVYVSCDPATQARDSAFLHAAGYRVTSVTPFDLFPQTRHIENVMVFVRD